MPLALLAAAAFAAYEAVGVKTTGLDIFYRQPIDQEYRNSAAIKWAAGALALGLFAALSR